MNIVPLKALYRDEIGTQKAKKIRSQKQIPGIVYGLGMEPAPINVSQDDFHHVTHTKAGENVVIRLEISGAKQLEKTVIIKEIQYHPITDRIRHIDFQAISLTEKIKVQVPLQVNGEAPGLKQGGILDVVHHEIEVECLPTNIPSRLEVEISNMNIGDAIHIREIAFPSGVTPTLTEDEVVVAIHAPKAEEVAAGEEAAPTEPELIAKEKKEGEEEGEEAEPEQPKKEAEKTKEK
jgi:large subunit ribosomal protein L25